jgi:hypothetical protein
VKPARYLPGPAYYLMGALALAMVVNGIGVALGAWPAPHEHDDPTRSIAGGVIGFAGICAVVLGWHRFVLLDDGLQVMDVRGTRLHRWSDLGRPRSREFVHGQDSILLGKDGMRGGSDPQAYSHYICDARGKTLYRLGPWYPERRAMMREVWRRIREGRR